MDKNRFWLQKKDLKRSKNDLIISVRIVRLQTVASMVDITYLYATYVVI